MDIWQGRDRLVLDGSMGQELLNRNVEVPKDIWSADALMVAPDVVRELHADYVRAGADIITTNNYACTPYYLGLRNLQDRLVELTDLSGRLAREAVVQTGAKTLVAGAMPPLGGSYDANDVRSDDVARPVYRAIAIALDPHVDLYICETMSHIAEARQAAEIAAQTGKPVWVSLTLHDDVSGNLRSGETLAQTVAALDHLAIDAWLFNCCLPQSIDVGIAQLSDLTDRPIGVYGNAFNAVPEGWTLKGGGIAYNEELDPAKYQSHAERWLDAGATIIGGCCGIGPDHIHEVRALG